MAKVASPEEVRDRLSRIGKTIRDVSRELNVDYTTVQGVLSGRLRGDRGDAHKVAVALGLKDGLIVGEGLSIADALKAIAA